MFRQALRRCARPTGTLAATLRPRAALPNITRQSSLPVTRFITPLNHISNISRSYSAEANATVDTVDTAVDDVADNGEIIKFRELSKLGVHRNLIQTIVEDLKYEDMTPVQSKTINPALKGTDIVAQAKTGTGKTIAFLLPMLNRMLTEDPTLANRSAVRRARADDIRGIVLSPTRELAEQIAIEARRIVRNTGLVVQTAVGGTNKSQMLRETQRRGCHLLVATPGRLNDLLEDSRSGIEAPNLAALVLDEADRMLDVGFEKELNEILSRLPPAEEKVRQTMLVSATIPDDVIRLARAMVRADDFEFVQTIAEDDTLTHDRVPQHVVPMASWANVFPSVFELIDREAAKAAQNPDARPFKAIVYFNTTSLVELAGEIAYSRRREGYSNVSSFSINSKLTQVQRTRAANLFRNARSGVLLSSDVTARGMDFPNVTHVIQVDIPRSREDYIHRLGRTGRQNKEGEGWLMLPPDSISSGRRMLAGLPIQQNKSLESAEADISEGELPPMHSEFKDIISRVPKNLLGSAYTSLFGAASRKAALSQDLYHWFTKGCGWSAPPAVSPMWARKMAIPSDFLNVQDDRFGREDRSGRDDRFGGSRERNFGGDRRSNDPFEEMGRNARSDRSDRSNRSDRNDRGFGGRRRGPPRSSW